MKSLTLLFCVVLGALFSAGSPKPNSNHLVFFHNVVPSHLFVNAAQGPVSVKQGNDGKSDIINLLLYPSDLKSRAAKTGRVVIKSGPVNGVLTLRQDNPPIGSTFIAGTILGLAPGRHGIRIFEFGDMKDNCSAVGNIYDPYNHKEGLRHRRAIGKLGFIIADGTGKAEIALADPFVSLVGPRSVIGRSIVITKFEEFVIGLPEAVTDVAKDGIVPIENAEILEKEGCGVIGYAS